MAQLKITIKNVQTGQTRVITETAYKILKRTKALKHYDVIEEPKKVKVAAAPKAAEAPKAKPEPAKEAAEADVLPKVDTNEDGKRSAKEVIAAIGKATNKAQVKALIDGERRKSVLQAAQKKNSKLKK